MFATRSVTLESVLSPTIITWVRAMERNPRTGSYLDPRMDHDSCCPIGACYVAKYHDIPLPEGMLVPSWTRPQAFTNPNDDSWGLYPPLFDSGLLRDVAIQVMAAFDRMTWKERAAIDWMAYPVEVLA
jgi:hypothetical protein